MAQYGSIAIDGVFGDWTGTDSVERPGNSLAGYQLYGKMLTGVTVGAATGDFYLIGLQSTLTANLAVGANTTIWLNTDQIASSGVSPFGNVSAEYYVNWVVDASTVAKPYLYVAGSNALVSTTPLDYAVSADGKFSTLRSQP